MVGSLITKKLAKAFPRSFINCSLEFIAHLAANEYFRLEDCNTELDVQCKVLEWLSRGSFKTSPYSTKKKNEEFHQFMLSGINKYLGTNFSHEDIEIIYSYLGNRCNHEKTVEFILSGYNMSVLKGGEE